MCRRVLNNAASSSMRAMISSREPRISRREAITPCGGSAAISRAAFMRFDLDLASGRVDRVDEAGALRSLGIHRPAHHQQRECARVAHQPRRDQAGGGFRHHAEADEGRCKTRFAARPRTWSQCISMVVPMPTALPCTAATNRQFIARQRIEKAHHRRADKPPPSRTLVWKSAISLPAQKTSGAAANQQAAQRRVLARRSSMAAAMASYIVKRQRVLLFRRFIRTVRTGPSSVTMTRSAHSATRTAASAFVMLSAPSVTLRSSPDACTAMFSAKKRASAVRAAPSPFAQCDERLPGQHAAAGGIAEQPQIRRGAGERGIGATSAPAAIASRGRG